VAQRDVHGLLARLLAGSGESSLRHVTTVPARAATTVDWPPWVPDRLRVSLAGAGVSAPWAHQVTAA
jgi:DEAD/DEAH box helicase domain-containing protein